MQLPDNELYEQLRAREREVATLTERAELAEGNFIKLQERCEMAKAYVNKFVDWKNDRIDQLKEQCHIISKAIKAEKTKVVEVE